MRRGTGIAAAGLAALAIGMGLAGCDDDDTAARGPTTTPAPVTSPPPSPAGIVLAAGGLTVAEVRAADPGTLLLVRAYVVAGPDGTAQLCDGLRESSPPQCGAPAMLVTGLPEEFLAGLREETGTRWSDAPVQLMGSVRDGTFVNDPLALAAG